MSVVKWAFCLCQKCSFQTLLLSSCKFLENFTHPSTFIDTIHVDISSLSGHYGWLYRTQETDQFLYQTNRWTENAQNWPAGVLRQFLCIKCCSCWFTFVEMARKKHKYNHGVTVMSMTDICFWWQKGKIHIIYIHTQSVQQKYSTYNSQKVCLLVHITIGSTVHTTQQPLCDRETSAATQQMCCAQVYISQTGVSCRSSTDVTNAVLSHNHAKLGTNCFVSLI